MLIAVIYVNKTQLLDMHVHHYFCIICLNIINPSCRSNTEPCESDSPAYLEANFSEPIYQVEEGDDELELSPELLRLVE